MSTFKDKSSYSLLKSNSKLTGNVKLVVDSKGSFFIESIDASPQLTRNKYKKIELNLENSWSSAIYDLFSETPNSLVYGIQDNEDFLSIKKDNSEQYYTAYQQGATPKISKLYDENISYFSPIWLEKNDIPDYFAIFKLPEPVSINTKDATTRYDNSIDTEIYNTNLLSSDTNSDYFHKTILSKSKIHKVFDMTPNSNLGKYLENHINDELMPDSSFTVNWDLNNKSTVNGISLKNGGFTEQSFNLFSEAFPVDRTVTEMDNLITNQFEKNSVIHSNIINLEFLFDDDDEDFSVNRYFGIYFNKNDISKFKLDSKAFYEKRYENIYQNRDIKSIYDIDINFNNNISLENIDGIKLFTDYEDNYQLKSTDVKDSEFLPYIYSTDEVFYDINTSSDWNDNEIVLKDTIIDTNNFKGFEKDSLGIIPSYKTNLETRPHFEFSITGVTTSFELRIKSVDESSSSFDINQVFVGDITLEEGTFLGNKFSLLGTQEKVAEALTLVINNYSKSNEDFNVYSIYKFNKIIIFTNSTNEYWNNYEFLIYSEDYNFENAVSVKDLSFESIITFNANRVNKGESKFLDYDTIVSGANSTYEDPDFKIIQSNFVGGNNTLTNKIRVPLEFKDYFSTDLFLKSKNWYTKIISVTTYLDEPIYQNETIVDFVNMNEYVTINCLDEIYVSKGSYSEIYKEAYNTIGLMSMYPTKQFDIDQFRSDYTKDGDGFIDKLEQNYTDKLQTLSIEKIDNISNNITDFKDSGFKNLSDDTEYDRLKENSLPQLAIKGRISPYINKWVYDDGKDVRDNGYRMNSNSAFSYDNFSPSKDKFNPDFRFFTHEWYYLQEYPSYLTTEEKINTFSYFDRYLDKTELYDNNTDIYDTYFTQHSVDNIPFPVKTKYSIVKGGNDISFGETFFRGCKVKFKQKDGNEGVFASEYFNDYKFSVVLTNDTSTPLGYSIIENKTFKTITMFIEASLDDYFLSRDTNEKLFLDRSLLYILQDKYDNNGNLADIGLTGSIVPFVTDDNGNGNIANFTKTNGIYKIKGIQNSNGTLPSFDKQIIPNIKGRYDTIEIVVNGYTKIIIDSIQSVTSDTIVCKVFGFGSQQNLVFFNTRFNNSYPREYETINKTPIYKNGGYLAYKSIINNISFSTIYDKVNTNSQDIKYITVNEDNSIVNDTFLIEMETPSENAKADYIDTEPILFTPSVSLRGIGSSLKFSDNTILSSMFRFNGKYNPKVKDVLFYNNSFGTKFNESIRDQLLFTNVQFLSTFPKFAEYQQLYYNKISTSNDILDPNRSIKPEFWNVGEIAIDKKDMYIFRSNWDYNYYNDYYTRVDSAKLPGYVDPKEVSSFLASTIMNLPQTLLIDSYSEKNIKLNRSPKHIVSGILRDTDQIIEQLIPILLPLFEQYVSPNLNYRQVGTFEDDAKKYIRANILPRYNNNSVKAFVKFSSKTTSEPIFSIGTTEQEMLTNGFQPLNDITFSESRGVDGSKFGYYFTYNKPSDKNVTLGFVSTINIT